MQPTRFQSFDDISDRTNSGPRLAALRAELGRRGVSGFILPRADRHQNEYVPPGDERLAWLTGFSGSAGVAVILADRAALFVDGRYTLQAGEQIDTALFPVVHVTETPPAKWLETQLRAGQTFGYDPWLHTSEGADKLAKACAVAGAILVPVDPNPIDAIWTDRPAPPLGAVTLHDVRYAGESAADKLARVRMDIGADALVVSDPHAVCWLFNIRGADVPYTPLVLSFAVVTKEGHPALYLDRCQLSDAVRNELQTLAEIREPDVFLHDLAALGAGHRTVRLDHATAADAIDRMITANGGKTIRAADPIAAMKTVKNATEIAGTRAAHLRDGAAVTRFLAWFDRTSSAGRLTEIDAVEALESCRNDTGMLKDLSFPTIAGAGPNGAIVHYRVTRKTNRRIALGELFLIDSGAQYQDGTTDITRTIAVGPPSEEMRDRFTRVLRGHIAIARMIFPDGTTGAQLDSFARAPLWAAGLDFDHGTGHGVGSYLSVHEGPARISKLGATPLRRGMILSNEPGYYKAGAYGIRIENLVLVEEGPALSNAEKPLDAFATLTLAPIDRRLIVPEQMNEEEIAWLDAYHTRVRETLAPHVDSDTRAWLDQATAPLARS